MLSNGDDLPLESGIMKKIEQSLDLINYVDKHTQRTTYRMTVYIKRLALR